MADFLSWKDIAPEIRGANFIDSPDISMGPRFNYAYQLLYVFKGDGLGEICGTPYRLSPGFFCLYGPADSHMFKNVGRNPLQLGMMNFSWRNEGAEKLAMGNRAIENPDEDFHALCDPVYQIEGLPDIPFTLTFPKGERTNIERILKDAGRTFRSSDDPAPVLRCKAAFFEIIHIVVSFLRECFGGHPALRAFRNFIAGNYASEIVRRDAALASGLSESRLTALLRSELNTNFTDYLTRVRMEAATELLQYSHLSVKEISLRCGFADYSYFVARFKSLYGFPPGEWRSR